MRGEGGGLTWADLMSKEEGYVSLCEDAENASEEELTSFKAELPTLLKTAAATVSTRLSRVVDESGTPISKVNLRPRPNVSEGAPGGVGEGGTAAATAAAAAAAAATAAATQVDSPLERLKATQGLKNVSGAVLAKCDAAELRELCAHVNIDIPEVL